MIPLVAIAAAKAVASLQKGTGHCSLSEIAEATAEDYAIPTVRLLGKRRGFIHEEARRVAIYLSSKVVSPEEIATFFGCEVSRIEVPEGEARRRMDRIENGLKSSNKELNSASEIK